MRDDLVERVARAIWMTQQTFAQLDSGGREWSGLPDYAQEHARDQARAALSALPTPDVPGELREAAATVVEHFDNKTTCAEKAGRPAQFDAALRTLRRLVGRAPRTWAEGIAGVPGGLASSPPGGGEKATVPEEVEPDAYGREGERSACWACGGTGTEYGETCLTCGGFGWLREAAPPLPVSGEGHAG